MRAVIGPVVSRDGGYAFDMWTPEGGVSRGFCYGLVEDARYARRFEMRSIADNVDCATPDQFRLFVEHCGSAAPAA